MQASTNSGALYTAEYGLKHNKEVYALPGINLDLKDLAYLTNYYFDTRYPGPDYHLVSKEDFEECKRIMYSVKAEVDRLQTL